MSPKKWNESAASEMIGALVLIAVLATAVAIVAVVLFSQPAPEKIPAITMTISNESKVIEISNDGGDSLAFEDLIIRVDDQEVSASDRGCLNCGVDLSVGDTIRIDYSNDPRYVGGKLPNKVDVIYKTAGVERQLLTTRYLGTMTPTPTSVTIPTTATAVPTVTPTGSTTVTPTGSTTVTPTGSVTVTPTGSTTVTPTPTIPMSTVIPIIASVFAVIVLVKGRRE